MLDLSYLQNRFLKVLGRYRVTIYETEIDLDSVDVQCDSIIENND